MADETKEEITERALSALDKALGPGALAPAEGATVEGAPGTRDADRTFDLIEDCRHGRFLVPKNDIFVGEALRKYGEYGELELSVILQLVQPQTRVVCVGANLGSLVVPISRKALEVVAFEPQRWVYQLLCANCVLNGRINVRPYWCAVGARNGLIRVPVLEPNLQNNFGGLELEAVQEVPGDLLPVYPLDAIPDIHAGVLTIDVEGMELDVINGAQRMIKEARPIIFFECDRELKKKPLLEAVRNLNYDLYWHRTPLFNPDNHRGIKENVFFDKTTGNIYVSENVMAVPRERGVKVSNFVPVLE